MPFADDLPQGTGVLPYRLVNGVVVSEVVVDIRSGGEGTPVLGYLLSRRVATNPNTPDTLSKLIGSGGRVLVGNQVGPVWTDIAKAVEAPPIDVTTAGVSQYRGVDGHQKLGAAAPLAGMPLAIVVEFPLSLILAPAWSILQLLSLVGVVFTIAATAIVWRLSANITRPLDQLAEGLREISAGDFNRRVKGGDHDEVSRLGEAFNAMAAKIEAGLHELDVEAKRKAAMMNAALDCIITTNTSGPDHRLQSRGRARLRLRP